MIAFIRFAPSTNIFYLLIGDLTIPVNTLDTAVGVAIKYGVDSIELDYNGGWTMSKADALHTAVWAVASIARELPPAAETHLRRKVAYPLQSQWLDLQPRTDWMNQLRTQLSQNRGWYAAA